MNIIFSSIGVGTIRLWNRSWPFASGKELPNRLLARATNMGLVQPAWFQFQPGLWMQLDIRDLVQETLLLEGIWEPKTTRYLCTSLRSGHVFIDIGANAGYFSLLASRCVGESGRVLAVEPNPAMAKQLQQNIERSGLANVAIVEAACSDCAGICELFVGNSYNTGNSSLSPNNLAWTKSVRVRCIRADLLSEMYHLQRVDLVKIDVEGAELQVLRGMATVLKHLRPKIIIELSPSLLKGFSVTVDAVQRYFSDLAYSVAPLDEDCKGRITNYLCIPV